MDSWTAALKQEDDQIKIGMHPNVRAVMGNKNIAVCRKLVQHLKYGDVDLIADMTQGFKMVGDIGQCHVYPPASPTNTASVEKLRTVARWAQHAVRGYLKRKGGDDMAKKSCLKEVEENTMRGPFTEAEVAERLGNLWAPMPRFVIDQGKPRPIDHGSLYGQNATVAVPWRLVLGG